MTSPGGSRHATRIVVGVDGSDSSLAALRWAPRQAKLAGDSVEAVIAWRYPVEFGWELMGIDADFAGTAQQVLPGPGSALLPMRATRRPRR